MEKLELWGRLSATGTTTASALKSPSPSSPLPPDPGAGRREISQSPRKLAKTSCDGGWEGVGGSDLDAAHIRPLPAPERREKQHLPAGVAT